MGGLVMTRRGLMQSCLALAAAPAIIRLESLMPLRGLYSSDWKNYVREMVQYMIADDAYMSRFDILYSVEERHNHYHVDTLIHAKGLPELEHEMKHHRKVAAMVLEDRLRLDSVRPGDLIQLPLPEDINWARRGIA